MQPFKNKTPQSIAEIINNLENSFILESLKFKILSFKMPIWFPAKKHLTLGT
jgi:hypothetical protein